MLDKFMMFFVLVALPLALAFFFVGMLAGQSVFDTESCAHRCRSRGNSAMVSETDRFGCVCSDATMWHMEAIECWQPGAP